MFLSNLFKRFRKGIILAMSLVIIEDIAWIIEPTILGIVIDALIDKEYTDPSTNALTPLLIWVGLFAINSGVGTLRRSLDDKIFLNMFTSIATEVGERSMNKNLSVSRTTARAELSYQYISFLQFRMPEILSNVINITGAIIAMYIFDWRISLTCLCIVFPLLMINVFYNKKVGLIQKEYHDKYEDIVDVFSKKDTGEIRTYYNELAKPQQRIANWSALNFGVMRFFLLIIFLAVLFIAIDLDEFSAGELFSIVAYLWTFVTASEYIPDLMESWTSLKDISRRLKTENV